MNVKFDSFWLYEIETTEAFVDNNELSIDDAKSRARRIIESEI